MGFNKETWMQLSDQEKCDILNSYKGKTAKWKEDNPDCSWSTATKNTNYWKDKNEKFMPGLSPEEPLKQSESNNVMSFTDEEIKFLKSLYENKNTISDKSMTLRGLNKKDIKSVSLRISKQLYNELMTWIESEENEYGFTQHEVVSILIRNFMEDKIIEKPIEKPTKKSSKKKTEIQEVIEEEIQEDIQEETTSIEFLSN